MTDLSAVSPHAWTLDPEVTYLNHGAFGACPRPVLERQSELRTLLEREPVRFFDRQLEPLLDAARAALAKLVHADPEDLVFVTNATQGVCTVLASLDFEAGDELLTTDHVYNACRNALLHTASRSGARVVTACVPFPLSGAQEIVDAVMASVTPKTRLALLDHVTSPTGLIFPMARLVTELRARGVATLVDGAHTPGMIDVDLGRLGADYYTANCHKWLCAPKGAAFLHVRRDHQPTIRPLTISHGANSQRTDRSRFLLEFDWTGTGDPTGAMCIPAAIAFLEGLMPGGLPALQARNRALALKAREILCRSLGVSVPAPDELLGSLAAVPIPDSPPRPASQWRDPLQEALFDRFRIEVPVMPWPAPPKRLIRIAAQAYNAPEQYDRLAQKLGELLGEGQKA
jgi:isopenicillin-N epimerase